MKNLMKSENYTSSERVDKILDKISKYGINTLSSLEREFLDAHKIGNENEVHNKLLKLESETIFEDDMFKFEYTHCKEFITEKHYHGTIYVPDLKLSNGKILSGKLTGYILYYVESDIIFPEFYYKVGKSQKYEIFDFCSGYEYELDNFLEFVVSELENRD